MIDPASKGRLPALLRAVCPLLPAAKMTYNTDMENTALSPEAQVVLDAANQAYDQAATVAQGTAAALRAAANQVVPANGSRKNNEIRAELLAIAAELEGLQ